MINKQYYNKRQIIDNKILNENDIDILLNDERLSKYIIESAETTLFEKSVIDCLYYGLIPLKESKTAQINIDNQNINTDYLLKELESKQRQIEDLQIKLNSYAEKFIEFAEKSQSIAENLVMSNRENNIIKAIESENPQKTNIFHRIFNKRSR